MFRTVGSNLLFYFSSNYFLFVLSIFSISYYELVISGAESEKHLLWVLEDAKHKVVPYLEVIEAIEQDKPGQLSLT